MLETKIKNMMFIVVTSTTKYAILISFDVRALE